MSRSDFGNSESASSPTENDGAFSPTKIDRPDFSKKCEIDSSLKKHVSIMTTSGGLKPKASAKKKKVAPTLVSYIDVCNFLR